MQRLTRKIFAVISRHKIGLTSQASQVPRKLKITLDIDKAGRGEDLVDNIFKRLFILKVGK